MQNISGLYSEQLSQWFKENGLPAYRASQVLQWFYERQVSDFSQMTNLPLPLREKMTSEFSLRESKLVKRLECADGTIKYFDWWDTATGKNRPRNHPKFVASS